MAFPHPVTTAVTKRICVDITDDERQMINRRWMCACAIGDARQACVLTRHAVRARWVHASLFVLLACDFLLCPEVDPSCACCRPRSRVITSHWFFRILSPCIPYCLLFPSLSFIKQLFSPFSITVTPSLPSSQLSFPQFHHSNVYRILWIVERLLWQGWNWS